MGLPLPFLAALILYHNRNRWYNKHQNGKLLCRYFNTVSCMGGKTSNMQNKAAANSKGSRFDGPGLNWSVEMLN